MFQTHVGNTGSIEKTSLFSNRNQLFLLNDTGAVCDEVGKVFKPHELRSRCGSSVVGATMHKMSLGKLTLHRLEYNHGVQIMPDRLEQFYLIQVPMKGYAEISCGSQRFISSPEVASLVSPDQPLSMLWQGGSPQLVIRIEKADFEHHCRQHLDQWSQQTPSFEPELDFDSPGGAYVMQLLMMLVGGLLESRHPIHQPLVMKQFESTLLNALLYGIDSNLSEQLANPGMIKVTPYFVKQTEEYIRANLDQPLSVESLAEQVGVSVRSLQAGFRKYRDTTPMALLRDLRLDRVNQVLKHADGTVSITDVAFQWGFSHLGRFSKDYRQRFDELPSETLRFRR
ncbi:AraC family transcriptional regulator [Oceanobacter mangrovi]|uniref:AraC family transcriptional regulator n=1 Tax=Oceanobacter mangrovi TaxID=2862510 RepID=UPI001C8D70B1|nr:AraC family transcriptional regulator [Oceanobacter mangrovi]